MYLLRSRCKCVNSLHAEGQTWRKARNTFFESMLLYPISSRHFKITCDRVGHFLQSVVAACHTPAAGGGVSCKKSSWQQLVLDVTHIFLPVCQFATYLFSTLTPTCPPVPDPLIIPPAYRPSDVSSGLFYLFFSRLCLQPFGQTSCWRTLFLLNSTSCRRCFRNTEIWFKDGNHFKKRIKAGKLSSLPREGCTVWCCSRVFNCKHT